MNFIDLFSGAGGLSEGFIRAGFSPIAHIEMDKNACDTLKTRIAYHYLNGNNLTGKYISYLRNDISRDELWRNIPSKLLDSVINQEISKHTISSIFNTIDSLRSSVKIDVVIGGPPCQAYSLVGRSRDPERMKWDNRNYLFRFYGEFLLQYKPKYFVFENVLGLLTAGNKKYLNEMIQLFESIGYSVAEPTILKAEDFGVLQKRRRVIIIGKRGNRRFKFPEIDKIVNKWEIRKDLFYDLPDLSPGEVIPILKYSHPVNDYLKQTGVRNGIGFVTQHITRPHNDRDLEIYSIAIGKWLNEKKRLKYTDLPKRLQTHSNIDAFLDRFKVIDPFGLSHTMMAHIAKDGHYYIYPNQNQVRSISVREAARIQSFPDDYFFEGGRSASYKQIGNAVPPLMAEKIATSLKNQF